MFPQRFGQVVPPLFLHEGRSQRPRRGSRSALNSKNKNYMEDTEMSKQVKLQAGRWLALTLATAALFMGAIPSMRARSDDAAKNRPPARLDVDTRPLDRSHGTGKSYAPVIQKVTPSVVQVYTTSRARVARGPGPGLGPGMDDSIFRWFFGDPRNDPRMDPRRRPNMPDQPRPMGMGSGVIVSANGYILTNNHVVDGADEVKVSLQDGREFKAEVIGKDPKTDVAVLKIPAEDLPFATATDSDRIEVGDVVMAIGNPFGVGQTVTMGIVSAKGRGLGIISEGYEDFIQTDASINPGNSGGALVDADGRLIGINTAIVSRSGGNQGIGFAIPINLAREVLEALIDEGRVTRGFLGVVIQNVEPALARKLELPSTSGVLVAEVNPRSPADRAGIRSGDVIVEFNKQEVKDVRQLRWEVARTRPGTSVPVQVIRNGRSRSLTVNVQELDGDRVALAESDQGTRDDETLVGVAVSDIDGQARRSWSIPNSVQGVLVVEVEPGSAAARAGLRAGDVILEINREPVDSSEKAIELTTGAEDKITLLRIWSQGTIRFVVVDESN